LQGAVVDGVVENNVGCAECKGSDRSTANTEWETCTTYIPGMSLRTISKCHVTSHTPYMEYFTV